MSSLFMTRALESLAFADRILRFALALSWLAYLLCFIPLGAESLNPALILMLGFGLIGTAAGIMALRNANYWWPLACLAAFGLAGLYGLAWVRAIWALTDVLPGNQFWTLLMKVLATKTAMIKHLAASGAGLSALQQFYWEIMALLQLGILVALGRFRYRIRLRSPAKLPD